MSVKMKYQAQRVKNCSSCGNNHDSKAEARECARLHMLLKEVGARTVWVDVFPVVTLPGGERWKLDFCVYEKESKAGSVTPIYIDVKGCETAEFKRKRKAFDRSHPAAPLRVVTYKSGRRIVTGNPER